MNKKTKNLKLKKQQNTEYTITIKQPWFNLIKSGKKTFEGRLNTGLFAKLHIL